MAGDFGIVYPLWCRAAEGHDLLDRVIGEVGIDHLTVPAVSGEVSQFRLNRLDDAPYFHTEGGWHFPPNVALYGGSAARPRTAKWFGTRDVLAKLHGQTEAQRLPLYFRVDLTEVRALAAQESALRQRNAWGQDLPSAPPCVLNPDLRELLRATLADLARYGPAGFELQGWTENTGAPASELRTADAVMLYGGLHNFCFCAACRQVATAAGVDAERAARSVRAHVAHLALNPADAEAQARRDQDEVLNAYQATQFADTQRWLEQLAGRVARRCFRVHDTPSPGEIRNDPQGWARLARPPTGFRNFTADRALQEFIEDLQATAIALPAWRPRIQEASHLVRWVQEAQSRGVTFFDFEGLDEAPDEAITWLKQAVRYARRG